MAAAIVSFAALAPASAHAEESRPTAPTLSSQAPAPRPQPREVYQLNLAVDIPVTVVAGSVGLVRVFFKDSLARRSCPCDPAGINRLDRGSVGNDSAAANTAADVTVYGFMFALPLVDLLDVGVGRAWGEDLMVYVETLVISTALQNAANFITARPRPRTYAGDPAYVGSSEGYFSFYAGHVTTAFSSLSMAAFTIRKRYGEQVWPWIVVGLVGGSVAVERVASGDHFPTDVAAAAVVSTGIGIAVPWLHLRGGDTRVQIVPLGAHGLGLAGAF
jgi:membrane-associated phospholipid phosphatase